MENFQKKFITALVQYAGTRGVSGTALFDQAGLSYRSYQTNAASHVNAQDLEQLWKALVALLCDEQAGLHLGEAMRLPALGVVGQIIQSSATVFDALTIAGSLTPLVTDLYTVRVAHAAQSCTISFTASAKNDLPFSYRHMGDYLLVFTMHELDGLLFRRVQPLRVGLPYTISNRPEYARIFRCEIETNADGYFMELDKKLLQEPILSANADLHHFLIQQLNHLIKPAQPQSVFYTKIYNYLLTNSFLYSLSLEDVAANFNISPRQLQRKLKEENMKFMDIVDAAKKDLALSYLGSRTVPSKDIAYLLGYNEPSAFLRAFKRWTGKTPTEYQNSSLS